MIRSRSEKLWAGEAPNKMALSDEKRYATKNEIKCIQYKNQVTDDKKIIEQAFIEQYHELFGKKRETGEGFANNFLMHMPRLEDEVRQSLEQIISVEEIKGTQSMHSNSAPPDVLRKKPSAVYD